MRFLLQICNVLLCVSVEPGRRLMERRGVAQVRKGLSDTPIINAGVAQAQLRKGLAGLAPPINAATQKDPDTIQELDLQRATNRTATLLRRRSNLLQQVAEIDHHLAQERDTRRAALTAKYEQELRMLDEEATRLGTDKGDGVSRGTLRDEIAAAVAQQRVGGAGSSSSMGYHQDIGHQDVDIDVVLQHIDTDGDGHITTAEVRSASAGAAVMSWGTSALVGGFGGILCYLFCRFVLPRLVKQRSTIRVLHPRRPGPPPASPGAMALKPGGTAGEARMRKATKKENTCGPAIAC